MNCSNPLSSLFCIFWQSVKIYLFMSNLFTQSIAKLFPVVIVLRFFAAFMLKTNDAAQSFCLSVDVTAVTLADGDFTRIPSIVVVSCLPCIFSLSLSTPSFELVRNSFSLLNVSYLTVIIRIWWSFSNMNGDCHKRFESGRTEESGYWMRDTVLLKPLEEKPLPLMRF